MSGMEPVVLQVGAWQLVATVIGGTAIWIAALWRLWVFMQRRQDDSLEARFVIRDKAEDTRFAAIEAARVEGAGRWERRFDELGAGTLSRDQAMHAIESRLVKVEAQLEHLPSHQDVRALSSSIAKLSGQIDGMGESVDALRARIETINDYLLEHK